MKIQRDRALASLVICEKASQANNLRQALGSRYGRILPARGHLLRLKEPDEVNEAWKSWSTDLLHPGHFYGKAPTKDPSAQKLLRDIRDAAKGVDTIIIATDCDREGQLIGQEIVEWLGFKGKVFRAMFNAEDPKSLQDAFAKLQPNDAYRGLYLSGVAREQADQIANLSLTRAATVTLQAPGAKGAIGIGRVKTPVLAIVCQRELEIINFKPQNYFEIVARASTSAGAIALTCNSMPSKLIAAEEQESEVAADEGSDDESLTDAGVDTMAGRIMDRRMAEAVAKAADGHRGRLSVTKKEKRQSPGKLYDLTALQAACASRFGWSGDHTLAIAQQLYSERQILTYPRGEARYIPEVAIGDVPSLVKGLVRLPSFAPHAGMLAKPEVRKGTKGHFSDKALEGMSHHAIIPNARMAHEFASIVPRLSADEARLFDLVSRSYLAALAPDYRYLQTVISMNVPALNAEWRFSAVGNVAIEHGWRAIIGRSSDDPADLPAVKDREEATLSEPRIESKETKPPARYNEGSLIKAMQDAWRFVTNPELKAKLKEAKGIGTPATRASIVKGLLAQGQLAKKGKNIAPTDAGMKLYQLILSTMPEVVNPGRTAQWETLFTGVERGQRRPEEVVKGIADEAGRCIAKLVDAVSSGKITISFGKLAKPNEKAVAYARKLAEEKGLKLPEAVLKDGMAMRLFLDQHAPKREAGAGGTYPPSEKQLAFARSLAERTGKEVPEEAVTDAKALSAWIDKAQKGAPPRPPSDKQLAFARKLAEEKDVKLPEPVLTDMNACSKFIDKMMKGPSSRSRGPAAASM